MAFSYNLRSAEYFFTSFADGRSCPSDLHSIACRETRSIFAECQEPGWGTPGTCAPAKILGGIEWKDSLTESDQLDISNSGFERGVSVSRAAGKRLSVPGADCSSYVHIPSLQVFLFVQVQGGVREPKCPAPREFFLTLLSVAIGGIG